MADTKREKKKYRVLTGMNYPPERRAEVGDVVDDIPVMSLGWLLEQGHIEPVSAVDASSGPQKAEKGGGGVDGSIG